jgi:hypothetical protein
MSQACPTCKGKGVVKCGHCSGTGKNPGWVASGNCPTCKGLREIRCPNCQGKGKI